MSGSGDGGLNGVRTAETSSGELVKTEGGEVVTTSPEMVNFTALHKRLAELLEQRGRKDVAPSYKVLTDFTGTGDVAQQLCATGSGIRRVVPAPVAPLLADFWPVFKDKKGKLPQAPDMLRSFLRASGWGDALAQYTTSGELVKTDPGALVHGFTGTGEEDGEVSVAGRFLIGQDAPVQRVFVNRDRILTATQAAELLGVSPRTLRKYIKPYRRVGTSPAGDRWLLSDLMRPEKKD